MAESKEELKSLLMKVKKESEKAGLKCIYMWDPKHDTSELKYKTETDPQTWKIDVWLPRGREAKAGKDWESGISRYERS